MYRGCPLGGNKSTEVVLFLEVTNVLSLWEIGLQLVRLSSFQRFHSITFLLYKSLHSNMPSILS